MTVFFVLPVVLYCDFTRLSTFNIIINLNAKILKWSFVDNQNWKEFEKHSEVKY